MSCFVVGKQSFAVAAGIVAGIAEAANQGANMDRFWLYDNEHQRNMTGTDFLEKFYKVYDLNRKSVSESWREEQKPDETDYSREFKKAVSVGKKLYQQRWENGAYLRTVQELGEFFNSIRYQIDNPVMERSATSFLNAVMVRLFKQLDTGEHDSWGGLELTTIEEIMTEEEVKTRLAVSRALGIQTA